MTVIDEIFEEAKKDFTLSSTVYDVEGPQINVGEEFRVQFRIHASTGKFRWPYVALHVFPNLQAVEVVNAPDFVEGTFGGRVVYTKHLPDFEFFAFESIRFKATSTVFPMYWGPGVCSARVFAKEGHLRIWNAGEPEVICRTYIAPEVLKCANGHEYPTDSEWVFCPQDGLPLE